MCLKTVVKERMSAQNQEKPEVLLHPFWLRFKLRLERRIDFGTGKSKGQSEGDDYMGIADRVLSW